MKTKILGLLLAFAVVFALSACGETDPCANGHTFGEYTSNGDATCTANGTETAKCANCDKTDTREDADSKLSHSYGEYTSNGDATCTANGTETAKCANCDATDTREDADSKLSHSYVTYTSNGDATCTANGTETAKCENCDETDTREIADSKLSHSYGEYTPDNNATCTADGTKSRVCSVCENKETVADTGSKLDHTFVTYTSNGDATCTANGTETAKCANCDATDTREDADSKLDHTYVTYTSNGDATCTANGTKTAKCENCAETETIEDAGSKLPHDYKNGECTVCGSKTCPEGHVYGEYEANNDATCTANGTETAKCENCDVTDTREIADSKLSHSFGEYVSDGNATCTADGTKTAKCESCEATDTIADEGSKLEHSFVTYTSNGDATCTVDGTKTAKCENCEVTETVVDAGSQLGHEYGEDNKCDRCGAEKQTNITVSNDYYWGMTRIVYSMTEATDSGALPSGTRRFYAGDVGDSTAQIDLDIKTRNRNAERNTNVKVIYDYSITKYDWSKAIDVIYKNSNTYTPGSSPDIYCNFVYDIGCAMLKGCFANLKANSGDGSPTIGKGNNYFQFNATDYEFEGESYFDSEAGKGYFYQYMLSLTLSDDKVYCLASNYCTDLIRAFQVVPVNITLMNTIRKNKLPSFEGITYDGVEVTPQNFKDKTNIEYFYALVWGGGWNYNTLAKFSSAVYKDTGTGDGGMVGSDLTDTLGFAIGTSLCASGVLYTSSVKILNKQLLTADEKAAALADPDKKDFVVGDYLVTYPTKNDEFVNFANALNTLFTEGANAGICYSSDVKGIRTRFVSNKVLFGSIIPLGQLEDADYQGMRKEDGFGIVPVPVYRAGDDYQTFVHNNARIVAIASLSQSYEQCAAFLDNVSTNSSHILNGYYEELAQLVQGDTGDDNVMMLTYIRNHVRDVFDKTFEDIMGDFNSTTDTGASSNRWHEILVQKQYKVPNMQTVYEEMTVKKTGYLKNVLTSWKGLGA